MGSGKKWALVANHYDRSLLRNTVALGLGQQFDGLAFTPDAVPVDVIVNGLSIWDRISSRNGSTSAADVWPMGTMSSRTIKVVSTIRRRR